MIESREIRLKRRLIGPPVADNFELATVLVAAPALGEVQVKNSVDVGRPLYAGSHGRSHQL